MNKNSVKTAGRKAKSSQAKSSQVKSTRRAATQAKKTVKSARTAAKSPSKSLRHKARAARMSRAMAATHAEVSVIRTPSPPMQPIVAYEVPIRSHKYIVGETVYFTSPSFGRAAASGSYTVVKLLPSEGDDYQYRIKSTGEAFERVAKESQLERP
jgi:hypothetical protein